MSQTAVPSSPHSTAPAPGLPRPLLHWLQLISRGVALLLAIVFFLNVLSELRIRNYRPDAWWIPFSAIPAIVEEMAQLAVAALLGAYAIVPPGTWARRRSTRIAIELLSVFIAFNAINFYAAILRGKLHTSFPIPFSLILGAGLWFVWWGVGLPRAPRTLAEWPVIIVALLLAAVVLPLMQMLCLGTVWRDDDAQVAVVFAAPLLPDGQPSPAMRARIDRAAQLFKAKQVKKIYVSGTDGAGDRDQAHAMRSLAIADGVPQEEIFIQVDTDNPQEIVRDVTSYSEFVNRPKIIAISEFEQLPRIHILFSQEEGWQASADTCPAGPAPDGTLKSMCREIVLYWEATFGALTR